MLSDETQFYNSTTFSTATVQNCTYYALKMHLSNWFYLPLAMCVSIVCSLNYFPEKFNVSQKGSSVSLTCSTDFKGQLTWKQTVGGHEMEVKESQFIVITGQGLHLHSVDSPSAGDYSCWGAGKKLDHTYLFLEPEESEEDSDDEYSEEYGDDDDGDDDDDDTKERDSFSCSAQTYSCSFSCHLFASGYTAARLSYHREGQAHTTRQYAPHGQNHFNFTLPLSYSPFAEESTALEVTVEAVNSRRYLNKTLHFYLRDIVRPDPPQTVTCERAGQTLRVTVQPPESWAQPISYFPLEHEVEFINRDDGKMERVASGEIKQRISMLRARSRDPLIPSTWSKWSPWKNPSSHPMRQHF
ncbi:hypothetical protein GJAV_G00026450 [Gymnothorax javanicus]|nr:hypothetical protein GJAV_G00026450 [Gymnothorax javanicus]